MPGDGRVHIAVDDTTCLMPEVARRLDITVVPADHDISEGAVTMSAVSPLKLYVTYARVLERSNKDGSDVGVVALYLGKGMSATWSNAVTAAGALDRVTVIDTDTVGAGAGAAAVAAAKAAGAGASRGGVIDVVHDMLQCYRLWLFIPKLDSLRRGDRISVGQAMLFTAPAIKSIAGVRDGSLALVVERQAEAKVKQRMVGLVTKMVRSASSASHLPAVLLHHSGALDDVHGLQIVFAEGLPDDARFRTPNLPESLAAHVGQGAYAVGTVSGGSIDSDATDFEAEMGVTALPHSVEESDARAVDVEAVDTADDDSGNIDNFGDSVGMDGSAENASATGSDEPIIDQAEVKVVGNPAASRNRNK